MDSDPDGIAALLPFEGRYELRQRRGADGPFESWDAFDRVLGREVILNRAYALTHAPRFIRAARFAASLRHPCFLPVYDLGLVGGKIPFYTTPPVPEEPLGHLLRKFEGDGPTAATAFPILPLVGAVRLSCGALEYAHRRGLLHLDLHPDSLLIGEDGHAVLADNDWKGAGARNPDEAGLGYTVGRPHYMSPEQFDEAGTGIGPATDVFGLGGILHAILFGTPPNHLPGKPIVEVLRAVVGRAFDPRRPGTLRPGILSTVSRGRIASLVAICMKSLAYEPGGRYPSAASLGEALDDWQGKARSTRLSWPWSW